MLLQQALGIATVLYSPMTATIPNHDLDGPHAGDASAGRTGIVLGRRVREEAPQSTTKPRRRMAGTVLLVWALSAAAVWRFVESRKTPAVQYKTVPVARRDLVGRTTATGTLSALVTVQVGTQVSGRIERLSADFNSAVRKGQVIATLDSQLFEATVQQAKANCLVANASISSAVATANNADKQAARSRSLHEKNLAAQADLDTAEANAATAHASVEGAKASMAQATAQLHQALTTLAYTKIVAPIDGVVISRNVDVGQTVAASLAAPTLFTIAQDLTKMQVDTNVAEGDIGRLHAGMQTYFTVDSFPDQRFFGVIRQIRNASTTVQNVVTYDAVIDVENGDMRLRPGMTANVTVLYAHRPHALAVPTAAFRFRPAQQAAVAVNPADARTLWVTGGGPLRPVVVQTGLTDGSFTEVLGNDLKESDEIVVQATGGVGSAPAAPKAPFQPGRPPPMF